MAQHDYVIANGTGAAVRSDLNNGLAAIVSQNSGTTEPTTTYAYMRWADTTAGVMKMRNGANNAWITLYQLDGEWSTIAFENGSASAPSIYFKDSGTDTGIYSPGADQVAISTNGSGRLFVDSSGRALVGTSSSTGDYLLEVQGRVGTSAGGAEVRLSRGETAAQIGGNGSMLGRIWFTSGSDNGQGAQISAHADATWASNDYPTRLVFATTADSASSPTERMRITSAGLVGIGNTNPQRKLVVSEGGAQGFEFFPGDGGGGNTLNHYNRSTSAFINITTNADQHIWARADGEKARLDSSGRLLVGTSSAPTGSSSQYTKLAVQGNSLNNNAAFVSLGFGQAATSLGTNANIATINFTDTAAGQFASIECTTDGNTGANDYPGRLVFSTTADGASSPTERMRIKENGRTFFNTIDGSNPLVANTGFIDIGGASSAYGAWIQSFNDVTLYVNRQNNDGTIISIRQAAIEEGTISVSGTTVSYNGAHLSRWSQLPSGAERAEILRGSVLSNLDEMCEWGEEDNEQLNRMRVSDVEGDKNVAGVFQAWDDDDDTYTNDFYCAMTGDFIIRIAEGVTVERGDLLMSAGDGTAKPQDDDIIRSKTIAKVTSTNVSCTYDDGSYCVPCVLMAC